MKIQDEFVPYSEALALKELGFDEPCFAYYSPKGIFVDAKVFKQIGFDISAPLYQQAFRWFREKYGIDSSINKQHHIDKYCVNLDLNGFHADDDLFPEEFTLFSTYEESELELLKKLIEIVKNK